MVASLRFVWGLRFWVWMNRGKLTGSLRKKTGVLLYLLWEGHVSIATRRWVVESLVGFRSKLTPSPSYLCHRVSVLKIDGVIYDERLPC